MQTSKKKSDVWNYFFIHPENERKAVCTFCKASVSRGGKDTKTFSTTNLKKHLDNLHKKQILNLKSQSCTPQTGSQPISQTDRPTASTSSDTSSAPIQCVTSEIPYDPSSLDQSAQFHSLSPTSSVCSLLDTAPPTLSKYQKIEEMFDKVKPLPHTSIKYLKITELIGKMICTDLLPFRMVENEGFRNLITYLEPRYEIPSRHSFSKTVIPNLYFKVKSKVKSILREANYISFTTDLWSTHTCEDFMSLTAHFINKDYQQVSLCLEVIPFDRLGHTANNISEFLCQTLNDWEITNEKVHLVIRDNAPNFVKALSLTPYKNNLGCTAHTLQLVIKDSLFSQKIVSEACSKARRIVGHFKHSLQATKLLKDFQLKNDLTTHRLIQDEPTRWDSTYLMLERLVEQRRAIAWLLPDLKINVELSTSEWSLLEELLELLGKFYIVTQNISKAETTVSEIIPTINGLRVHLTSASTQPSLTSIKKDMVHSLNIRFRDIEKNSLLAFATILDPRFKNTVFQSDENYIEAIQLLKKELSECHKQETAENPKEIERPPTTTKGNTIHDLYRGTMKRPISNEKSSPVEEINMYLNENLQDMTTNPFVYWKTAPYSILKTLARKYLSAPSGTVASERLFSTAGLIFSKKRSSLNPEKLRQLVFLNKNVNIL